MLSLLTAGTIVVGAKGFTGVARAAILVFWACLILVVFNVFFIGVDGHVRNLFPLARPKPFGGMMKALVWFGDPSVFLLSTSSKDKKRTGFIIGGYVVSLLTICGFYLLLIFTYGAALKDVGAAFSRVLLMNKTASEIGALDWPMMTVWLSMGFFHCSLLFAAIKKCFSSILERGGEKKFIALYVGIPVLSFLIYYFLFKNKEDYVKTLTSTAVALTVGILEYAIPIVCAILTKVKGKKA